jgi:hypothetical protein
MGNRFSFYLVSRFPTSTSGPHFPMAQEMKVENPKCPIHVSVSMKWISAPTGGNRHSGKLNDRLGYWKCCAPGCARILAGEHVFHKTERFANITPDPEKGLSYWAKWRAAHPEYKARQVINRRKSRERERKLKISRSARST